MAPSEQDGLEWKQTLFDLVPKWTKDPSTSAIEHVCRQQLKVPSEDPCTVTFHAEGLFNKVYLVHATGQTFIMRVTLPVYPRHKTRAEVLTLKWVHEYTSIPVARVFGYDASNDNEIGFEWILMEYMQGTSARKRWRTMSMEQKVTLAKQFAVFQFDLSGLKKEHSAFTTIGTLESPKTEVEVSDKATHVVPGRMVAPEFFMGDHLNYDVQRGPFRSSHDWLSSLLAIIIRHETSILEHSTDEDEIDDAETILPVAQTLLTLLPKIFPSGSTNSEPSALQHHDLNLNNMLVNEQGEITAVLDWECVSALPLWMLPIVPKFLDHQPREDEPQRDLYTNDDAKVEEDPNDPDYLDNEGANELYWIHQMEYETTQLRKVYKAELQRLCPELAKESVSKIDFYDAVSQCDGFWTRRVAKWVQCMLKGENVRFQYVLAGNLDENMP